MAVEQISLTNHHGLEQVLHSMHQLRSSVSVLTRSIKKHTKYLVDYTDRKCLTKINKKVTASQQRYWTMKTYLICLRDLLTKMMILVHQITKKEGKELVCKT